MARHLGNFHPTGEPKDVFDYGITLGDYRRLMSSTNGQPFAEAPVTVPSLDAPIHKAATEATVMGGIPRGYISTAVEVTYL